MILKGQDGTSFQRYLNTLPENQRDSTDFNVYRYWELNGKPKDFNEAVKKRMFTFNKNDGYWHANSIAYNKDANEYEFMKFPEHSTVQLELDAYNKNKRFKKNWQLDSTAIPWKYVPKHQSGGILSLWKKAYDSKLGNGIRTVLFGQDYDLSDEEYLEKHGFTKPLTGMAPLPTIPESGPFQGIENLAQGNFGTGAVYNAGLQNKLTKIASDRVLKNYSSSVSKWDKFLQRSLREQDDIVKFWNGEKFKSMKQLQQYPKEFNKFKNWILKHQQGGIFDVAYNPYLKQEQPTEFVSEIPEPYVPSYTFNKPQEEQIVIAPLPEVQETKEPETVEKDPDAVGHFRNFGDSIDFYEGGIYTKAYRDAHGWSIGKGHFLGTEDKWKDYTITKEQAQKMLEQDYKRIKDALDKQIAKHPEKSKIIDDVRYNVLFDLGFNIGTGYYDKIFNDWDGTKEGMANILNKYGRHSLATDPNRKAQEEKALAKRVDARIRAWNA